MKRSILGGLAFLLASTNVQAQEINQFPEIQALYDEIRYTDDFKKCVEDPLSNFGNCTYRLDSDTSIVAMRTQGGPVLYIFEIAYDNQIIKSTKGGNGFSVYGFNSSNGKKGIWPNQLVGYNLVTDDEKKDFLAHLALGKRMEEFTFQITRISEGAKRSEFDKYLELRPYLEWWGEFFRATVQKRS